MKIIFTRETDNATFQMGGFENNYSISTATKIPQPAVLDATGYEYSGAHGGYQTAARFQRRAFDLVFDVREKPSDPRGIISLLAQGSAFFAPSDTNLNANLFTADFYTNDKENSEFRLRHGGVSAPFSAPFNLREHFANGSISFIFGDPLLYYIGNGGSAVGGIVNFTLFPTGATPTIKRGREWTATGAVWNSGTNGGSTAWDFPHGGGGGNTTTVNFTTELPTRAQISIMGQITNPEIINSTNGSSFSYVGTIADSQILTVDTNGTVLLNNTPAPGTWSGALMAQDGLNSFVLNSDTSDANGRADIVLRGNF